MRRALAILLLGAALPASAGDLRDAVMSELSGIEDPPTAESLRALGEAVGPELLEIAQDTEVGKSKRGRAVHALGWFPTPAARSFLDLAIAGQDARLARKAAYALANGWGDAALPQLSGALASTDVQTRIAAAGALAIVGTEPAREALKARLADESEPAVRESIESAIQKR